MLAVCSCLCYDCVGALTIFAPENRAALAIALFGCSAEVPSFAAPMEPAFILCKHNSKLYNLACKIKPNIKTKLVNGEVFVVSAKASLKDAAGLVTPITVESPSRFVNLEILTPEAAKASATLCGSSVLDVKFSEWEGLTFCTDFPSTAATPAPDADDKQQKDNVSTAQASF